MKQSQFPLIRCLLKSFFSIPPLITINQSTSKMANALKGGSVMLSLFSSRSTAAAATTRRTITHCSFLSNATRFHSKFPFFSLSSSPRAPIPSGFPSFCTLSSSPTTTEEAVTEAVTGNDSAAETETEKNSIKDTAGLLDIRVGRILRAWKHDEADSLYVEEVDIGEPEPRIICSGLVSYIPLEHLQVSFFIVFFN